jgi:hypothetical protein
MSVKGRCPGGDVVLVVVGPGKTSLQSRRRGDHRRSVSLKFEAWRGPSRGCVALDRRSAREGMGQSGHSSHRRRARSSHRVNRKARIHVFFT